MRFKSTFIKPNKNCIKSCRRRLLYQFGIRSLKGKKSNFPGIIIKKNNKASTCVSKVHKLIGKITMGLQRIQKEAKIPIDYKHNQTGLHEITICDSRSNVKKTIPGQDFPHLKKLPLCRELLFPLNWKWNSSNSRNKPTADWISNKNAIASNNVSFESNAVRYFHGLRRLLKTTFLWPAFYFRDIFLLFLLFSLSHCPQSAWWLVTCRSTNHS